MDLPPPSVVVMITLPMDSKLQLAEGGKTAYLGHTLRVWEVSRRIFTLAVLAGAAIGGTGGSMLIHSGYSYEGSSGAIILGSSGAGEKGTSGGVSLSTGVAYGSSGSIEMQTGDSMLDGQGGDITVQVGTSSLGLGSDLILAAGSVVEKSGRTVEKNADSVKETGGSIIVRSGRNQYESSSGVLAVGSSDAGGEGSAKAWLSYENQGTASIIGSFNTASVTDNGTGDYTTTYTSSMADTTYNTVGMGGLGATSLIATMQPRGATAPATGSCRFTSAYQNAQVYDCSFTGSACLGDLA